MDAGSAAMFPSAAYEVFLCTNSSSALVLPPPLLPLLPGWSPLPILGCSPPPPYQKGQLAGCPPLSWSWVGGWGGGGVGRAMGGGGRAMGGGGRAMGEVGGEEG